MASNSNTYMTTQFITNNKTKLEQKNLTKENILDCKYYFSPCKGKME